MGASSLSRGHFCLGGAFHPTANLLPANSSGLVAMTAGELWSCGRPVVVAVCGCKQPVEVSLRYQVNVPPTETRVSVASPDDRMFFADQPYRSVAQGIGYECATSLATVGARCSSPTTPLSALPRRPSSSSPCCHPSGPRALWCERSKKARRPWCAPRPPPRRRQGRRSADQSRQHRSQATPRAQRVPSSPEKA